MYCNVLCIEVLAGEGGASFWRRICQDLLKSAWLVAVSMSFSQAFQSVWVDLRQGGLP